LRKEVLSHKTIAITGANGFIGSNLKNYFLSQGYYIKCFQRTNIKEQEKRVTFINYDLQLPLSTNDFLNVDILVHCAFATHSNKCKNADEINVNAAERIIEMCRLNKIKIIFLSSFSAHSSAQSHYGLNKLLLENMFDQKRDLILKLGLIVGNGGMFLKIKKLLDNKYIIPLIDNGNHPVQTIGMQDLLKICHVAINKEIVGKYYIAEEKSRTIKSIFLIIREKKSRNLFLPISSNLLLKILKVTEWIGVFLPFSKESVLGLKCGKIYNTVNDLKTFGITVTSLEEIFSNNDLEYLHNKI